MFMASNSLCSSILGTEVLEEILCVCVCNCNFQSLKGAEKQEGDRLFTLPDSDGTGVYVFKLKEGKLSSYIRKEFFIQTVVRHWCRLPTEAVDSPSLDVAKARLDGTMGSLSW